MNWAAIGLLWLAPLIAFGWPGDARESRRDFLCRLRLVSAETDFSAPRVEALRQQLAKIPNFVTIDLDLSCPPEDPQAVLALADWLEANELVASIQDKFVTPDELRAWANS